jgi:hypothetical protein
MKEDEKMANGISKFRSLLDKMAGVGIRFSEGDKTNFLLSNFIHGKVLLTSTIMSKTCLCRF